MVATIFVRRVKAVTVAAGRGGARDFTPAKQR
jgi:hypothetical protein